MSGSKIFSFSGIVRRVRQIVKIFDEDRISVYAAQASFFVVISAIPLLLLVITFARFFIPENIIELLSNIFSIFPENVENELRNAVTEFIQRPSIQLISINAIATFWSASRGLEAIRRGIKNVWGNVSPQSFLKNILFSFVYTIIFLGLILATFMILVLGNTIQLFLETHLKGLTVIFDAIIRFRMIWAFVLLTLFFTYVYHTCTRTIHKTNKNKKMPSPIIGAAVAAAGWMVYSFGYSLYIKFFPNVSYVYGSIAAIVLFMLWLYFCMIILLIGAEINKAIYMRCETK